MIDWAESTALYNSKWDCDQPAGRLHMGVIGCTSGTGDDFFQEDMDVGPKQGRMSCHVEETEGYLNLMRKS